MRAVARSVDSVKVGDINVLTQGAIVAADGILVFLCSLYFASFRFIYFSGCVSECWFSDSLRYDIVDSSVMKAR